jgi:hypothetical protein
VNAQAEAAIGGEGGGDETAMQVMQRRSFTFEQRNCTRAARSSSFICALCLCRALCHAAAVAAKAGTGPAVMRDGGVGLRNGRKRERD